jgi:DNA mismatch repair protein MSH2
VEEDFAGQVESSPIILAVKASAKGEERKVGVCFADASVRELGVSEFSDNDLYSNFEACGPLERAPLREHPVADSFHLI